MEAAQDDDGVPFIKRLLGDACDKEIGDTLDTLRSCHFLLGSDVTLDDEALVTIAHAIVAHGRAKSNDEPRTKQRQAAPELLGKLSKNLSDAAQALREIDSNQYAQSAINAELCRSLPINELSEHDDAIIRFNQFEAELVRIAELVTKAAVAPEYSNALPEKRRGRLRDDHMHEMIGRMEQAIRHSIERAGMRPQPRKIPGYIERIMTQISHDGPSREHISDCLKENQKAGHHYHRRAPQKRD